MESEPNKRPQDGDDGEERILCTACLAPNDQQAHFCAKCGAPMSSYAATGPFESVFAEGHVYRQAAEKPRRFVVVLGVWMLFGLMALGGVIMAIDGRELGFPFILLGSLMLSVSVAMIWKTTRNYLSQAKAVSSGAGGSPAESSKV